jgi:hypothetical protein
MNRETDWWKSSYSSDSDNCVEVRVIPGGIVLRNSKDPDGPRVTYTEEEWDAFLKGAADGEFNLR